MARLTEHTEDGGWKLIGLPWKRLYAVLPTEYSGLIFAVLLKLKKYEDTGLEPGEVRAQKAENQLLKDALAKSATPGKWLPVDGAVDMARCSVCGETEDIGQVSLDVFTAFYRFCPFCGARMDGGKEHGKTD